MTTTNARARTNWSKEKSHKGPGDTTRSYSLRRCAGFVEMHRLVSTPWGVMEQPVLLYKTIVNADRAGREWIADVE